MSINLHMKSKVFSIHEKMDILDENEEVVYEVSSKVMSIHNTTYLRNAEGKEVAVITKKPLSLHEKHEVEMADGTSFELRTELFHVTKDVINIESLGWSLCGDFTKHDYEIQDGNGNVLARTHIKWFSVHQIFCVEVLDESQIDRIIALYVALERIVHDRNVAAAGMAGSAGTAGAGASAGENAGQSK